VPDLVGGGDAITQLILIISGREILALIPIIFLLRLGLGAVSYAAGTPGGLFAPMLVLGAQLGLFFGQLSRLVFPDLNIQPEGFAVVGMAAFFVGVVRAPLTGIVLVVEMAAMARKTSGSSCGRTGSQIGSSNPSTISSITATLGTPSSISLGKSCPSRAATGQLWVTQCEY
jgi:hypothetical protein